MDRQNFCGWTLFDLRWAANVGTVQHVWGGSQGQRTTACGNHRGSCHGQSCGAVCSRSARSVHWAVLRRTRKISIRANRPYSCSMIVARHAIGAPPVSPGAARVPRCSSSCRSIIRAVRRRPRSSLPIWRRSTVRRPAGRGLPRGIPRGQWRGVPRDRWLGIRHSLYPGPTVRDPARATAIQPIEFRLTSRRLAPPAGGRSRNIASPRGSTDEASLRSGRPGLYRSGSGPRRGD
jgi:hypothetical protein